MIHGSVSGKKRSRKARASRWCSIPRRVGRAAHRGRPRRTHLCQRRRSRSRRRPGQRSRARRAPTGWPRRGAPPPQTLSRPCPDISPAICGRCVRLSEPNNACLARISRLPNTSTTVADSRGLTQTPAWRHSGETPRCRSLQLKRRTMSPRKKDIAEDFDSRRLHYATMPGRWLGQHSRCRGCCELSILFGIS